jgi:hypothetical protein
MDRATDAVAAVVGGRANPRPAPGPEERLAG